MKTTPAGFADVVEAAEALQLRGAALEAMAAMFGFALPSSSDAIPLRPPSLPRPAETDDDAGDVSVIAAAAEALSPSVRRLEPVRQTPAPASSWIDPLSETRESRSLAAQRERIRQATCRIEGLGYNRTGFLVSGNRIVTAAFEPASPSSGFSARLAVTFPERERSWATLRQAGLDTWSAAILVASEPIQDLPPLMMGRAREGSCEGVGTRWVGDAQGPLLTGRILNTDTRDASGRPALALEFDQWFGRPDRLEGTPIVQGGRVVGVLLEGRPAADRKTAFAARAEDIVRTLLPNEILHEPVVEAAAPQPLAFEGLFAPRDAVALLRLAASMPMPTERIDVARVTGDLARAKPLLTLPRLQVPSLASGALLLVDVGQPMQPFWEDQQELVDRFRRSLRGLADVRFVGDAPLAGAGRDRRKGSWTSFELPRPGTPVIALSDLGCGFPPRPETARAWLALAGQLRRRQCRVVAFAPVRPARVVPALRRAIAVAIRDRAARRHNLSRLTRLTDG